MATCEICQVARASRTVSDIHMCQECFAHVKGAREANPADVQWARGMRDGSGKKVGAYLTDIIDRVEGQVADALAKAERAAEKAAEKAAIEERKAAYARSVSDSYEYKIVKLHNEKGGAVDVERMSSVLAEHAASGWRLHTIYSNELGKESSTIYIAMFGFNVNATVCEDVLIFERRVLA